MSKYQAPAHVSGIGFTTGRQLTCDAGGVLEAPDDLTLTEIGELIALGFELVSEAAPAERAGKKGATPSPEGSASTN